VLLFVRLAMLPWPTTDSMVEMTIKKNRQTLLFEIGEAPAMHEEPVLWRHLAINCCWEGPRAITLCSTIRYLSCHAAASHIFVRGEGGQWEVL